MKFLKFFKQKRYEAQVAEICKKYNIRNWSINSNGLVDVDSEVILTWGGLEKLPLNFGYVRDSFLCYSNELTSLQGSPKSVGGSFYCSNNKLTSLQGGPQSVGNVFDCFRNKLTSLEGSPQLVGGDFDCNFNRLTSLRFGPEEVGGRVNVLPNPISDIPKEYLTDEYLQFIVKEQNNDWRLYRKDGSIYPERLEQMIEWGIETKKINSR